MLSMTSCIILTRLPCPVVLATDFPTPFDKHLVPRHSPPDLPFDNHLQTPPHGPLSFDVASAWVNGRHVCRRDRCECRCFPSEGKGRSEGTPSARAETWVKGGGAGPRGANDDEDGAWGPDDDHRGGENVSEVRGAGGTCRACPRWDGESELFIDVVELDAGVGRVRRWAGGRDMSRGE